jgi:hypothetical protein
MIRTHTSFRSYKYTHTTDGVNDHYLGTDAVSGFAIADFAGKTNITVNILINFPALVNEFSAQKRLLEIANSARTGLWTGDIGAFTATLTNEYIGVASLVGGVSKGTGVKDGGNISAGWHMVTFTTSATGSSVLIDGVKPTNTVGSTGDTTAVSTGFTANKFALMASAAGGVPYACEWRECSVYSDAWLTSEILALYKYYTRNGNVTLGNSKRSAARYFPKLSTLIDLYKGNVSGSALKAHKSATHDLVLTGF